METRTSITSGQEEQLRQISKNAAKHGVDLAIEKVEADTEGWQKVVERGDELRTAIAEAIVAKIRELSISNKYADEEVKSKYTYPKEYKGPKSIEKQVEILLKYFPGLDPEPTFRYMRDVYPKLVLPKWVEGAFAVPNEYVLAEKFYPKVDGRSARYCSGVNLVLEKIALSGRAFHNYRAGQITSDRFQRISRTADMVDRLIEMQKGADIIIHPMQLGLRWRGRSVRRGHELYIKPEFGEGSLEVGSVVLTHPERLVRWEELDMDCAGDQFAPDAVGDFCSAPYFSFLDGKAKFDTDGVGSFFGHYGSVSGALPECLIS